MGGIMAEYVCGVCGWTYDGDIPFAELPDNFICPMCGAPKAKFKTVEA
jgi:rubredoxin